MSRGYVYILSNPSMPGLYKIGRSINGGKGRAAQIDGTGVPTPFVLEFEVFTEYLEDAESDVHANLERYRENNKREFFRADVETCIQGVLAVVAGYMGLCVVNETEFIDPATIHHAAYLMERDMGITLETPVELVEAISAHLDSSPEIAANFIMKARNKAKRRIKK